MVFRREARSDGRQTGERGVMGVMRRTILIGSLVFLAGGCATLTKPLSKPELRQSEKADFKIVAPHLAALMKVQGDLPPRPECPIGFAVLKTSALNAWVSVPSEPRKPLPPVKALGETKEAPPPDPTPPLPPRCHKFDLVLTSAVLVLPRDQLRAVIAHELGHVYLGHIESLYAEQTLRNGAELFVIGVIPFLVLHAGTYPFMSPFSGNQEGEADRLAVDLLVRSHSSCRALVTVLERFQRTQEQSSTPRFEWLSSHPSPERRIEKVRELCRAR